MNKEEIQQRILQNSKPLPLEKFEWDEETKTITAIENCLVLDFCGVSRITFNVGDSCIIRAGSNNVFNTGNSCMFKAVWDNIFNTKADCTFYADTHNEFNTSHQCVFNIGGHSTVNIK